MSLPTPSTPLDQRDPTFRLRKLVHFSAALDRPGRDPVGTGFTMRHGKVVDIIIGSFG